MQKLRLVNPTVVSLAGLAIVLFIFTTPYRHSFFDTYGVVSTSSSGSRRPIAAKNSTRVVARVPKGCDIFRGEWVPDDGGAVPYYTNRSCPYIQEHQNCMKYGRPDLGFLKWRWRPSGCELPRFDAAGFLDAVRGRSMAFVGDSLARNHMQSLMCLLSKVEYPKDVSPTQNQEFRTLHYASHNFTVSVFWSPFLVKANLSDSDNGGGRLWNLYLDKPDDAWLPLVAGYDYVVISAATWFTRPSLFYESGRLVACYYCLVPGVPQLTLRYSLRVAHRTALRAVASLPGFNGTAIVRTVSPMSHFEGGEWDKGGDCRRTRPYEARVAGLDLDFYTAQVEEFEAAEKAARGRGVRMVLMDTTAAMVLRPDGHPSRYGHWAHENVTLYNDCVHWCLPGPIDVWNEMLLQMLLP
ncbi:protein trichome birefringence-like 21 [Lolium rigidum]|uniref:protein trichome birefringence-like 21 n=1 Tax=Lolium rigidum TaxID=89674 RepID=UPI001F5D5CD2|nr:protein trichome birefringence-like 21 [Lolium rigidum]